MLTDYLKVVVASLQAIKVAEKDMRTSTVRFSLNNVIWFLVFVNLFHYYTSIGLK